jgi:2-polyprenyl-6-methoxyphenol hydroxylase-like FAD-dependent oxidoreductase
MSNGPHFLSGRHIVVAGAGMAGLSFAVALRKLWLTGVPPPRITIFERDSEHDALGREGYSLSLAGFNNTGGLVALRNLGLLDKILSQAILKHRRLQALGCRLERDTKRPPMAFPGSPDVGHQDCPETSTSSASRSCSR